MSEVRHKPSRPSWDCGTCGEAWPCATRRERLLHDYVGRRSQLRSLMATYFIDALEDVDEPMNELHARFVGWVCAGTKT